jgi:glucose-1-phosphate adenylyltransferase
VLSSNVYVGEGSSLDEAVVLPGARIGSGCRLRRLIIDAGVEVPDGTIAEGVEEIALLAQTHVSPQQDDELRSVA